MSLGLVGCEAPPADKTPPAKEISETGIRPHIVLGDVPDEEKAALLAWIEETAMLMQSPEFEANFLRASALYPDVYVSKTQDIIPTRKLLGRLKTEDPVRKSLWWPKTYVVLIGETPTRSDDREGFGFEGNRKAATGPYPQGAANTPTGEIELGRLHFARYTQGDAVEKSCAINTMTHEIAHTLSDKDNQFWMHILDSQRRVTPPKGVF